MSTNLCLKLCNRNPTLNYLLFHRTRRLPSTFAATLTSQPQPPSERKNRPNAFSFIKHACRRLFCSESGPPSTRLPPLLPFPEVAWPSVVKSLRNFILTTFIIRPYMDRDFNVQDFIRGSKKAVEIISQKLASGELKTLDGFVSKDIIPNLQSSLAKMSLAQREQLAIQSDDIYFSFPYQIGIMFDDDDQKDHKRFVEITMVYHAFRGLGLMRSRGEEIPSNVIAHPDYQNRISICNYRFIREFTKGVDADWTVNMMNHFTPSEFA